MQEKRSIFETSVRYIKGVGPKRLKVLNRLGIVTILDLLYYFPRRYEDRSRLTPISQVRQGTIETVKGRVLTLGTWRTKSGMVIFQLAVDDGSGIIYATWFNQPYLKKRFKVGDELILSGKVDRFRQLQISSPDYEILSHEKEDTIHTGRIVPIYPLTQDLNQRAIRTIIRSCLDRYSNRMIDWLPLELRVRCNLIDIQAAIRNIHFPESFEHRDRARQRLIFGEFFLLQLGLAIRKRRIKDSPIGIAHRVSGDVIEILGRILPFELTAAQRKVMAEVAHDMRSSKPMARLIQGDVGSGKTVVALYALLLTIRNGYQGVLMVPTEVLAEQHYMTISDFLLGLDVNVTILISGLAQGARGNALEEIRSGRADIIIGTHALIQKKVEYKRLGLVIIDEQHKFGVRQRVRLKTKAGLRPDYLVMSATPIPRTLALTLYGDLDISVIDELPPGRRPVATYWVGSSQRAMVYQFIREEIRRGRQAYIVYPLVEESKKFELEAATENRDRLQKEEFPDLKVDLIHGRMKADEKEDVLRRFKDKETHILVSTTIIEVGIDITDASVILIENAERFGLAQLHQLRGRVGRGAFQSYCILTSDARSPSSLARLRALIETQNGFRIAESDLQIRGPGEFFGTRQHGGLPELKLANILQDMELLEVAREGAFRLVEEDPILAHPRHRFLRENLRRKFSK